ncbi:MAG: o-succinylbenzoate synthase [Cyclobacteriaceae bacterium]
MTMKCSYYKHRLNFSFAAGTSRGVLRYKDSYFILVSQVSDAKLYGIGECGPLPGLSPDDRPDFEQQLSDICQKIEKLEDLATNEEEVLQLISELVPLEFPSIRFGLEVALLDLLQGGQRQILPNPWSAEPYRPIPINGLVWMGDHDIMKQRIEEKLAAGFNCIKMKIGAIDFEKEIALLSYLRERFTADQLSLRVDANGAFTEKDVFQKLEALSRLDIHSIEQPIKPGQYPLMRKLCAQSAVPIALDEELIGVYGLGQQGELLDAIRPHYIILKPTLLGGLQESRQWIRLAEERNMGWWITSALESNIGLNAIAQFTATFDVSMPQGLGTGQLYENNIPSPMQISEGTLKYDPLSSWNFKIFRL